MTHRDVTDAYTIRSRNFEDFFRTWRDPLVRALTLTLRDLSLGAEAADEAMARAFQRWDTVSRYDNPLGWCYRVGLNWARSRLRKARRETGPVVSDRPVWDPTPLDPAVARGIGRLSPAHRSVVVLRYFFDWPLDTIAEALDVREGTVKSRLHRALRSLRSTLEER